MRFSNKPRFEDLVFPEKESAKEMFERRLFILLGNKNWENLLMRIPEFPNENILVVSNDESVGSIMDWKQKDIVKHKETKRILGKTYDNALIDLRDHMDVISLSRSIETVRGGGLIFLLLPISYRESEKYLRMLQPISVTKLPRDLLRRRLLIKALRTPGVHIFSTNADEYISINVKEQGGRYECIKLNIPVGTKFPYALYRLCVTQDQINVLKKMENLDDVRYLLITADRGRGKSAIVGIGITGYAKECSNKLRVVITAPERDNVVEIFKFLEIAHDALDIPFTLRGDVFESGIMSAEYMRPYDAFYSQADILVVDEAAGIQFPLLRRLTEKFEKIVFSTTIHGYEGSGRTFSVRFISLLKERDSEFEWVTMHSPIRYSERDPIEKWIFDSLLLDAEPKEIRPEQVKSRVNEARLVEYDPQQAIFNDRLMKQFFGILVTAHYRNNPNDLLMLCDAPHHHMLALTMNNDVIVSLQISEEGEIPEDTISIFYETAPSSHIIPDKVFKYYGRFEFLRVKGWRIVRIATHHNLMRMGFGSKALKELEKIAKQSEIAWIGAGFSAYPELIRFWIRNDFIPIHLSPKINKTTGEHTIIVIKPLIADLQGIVREINIDLKRRLLDELPTTFKNLDPESALLILKSGEEIKDYEFQINEMQAFRLSLYLRETLHFESASDVVTDIVKYYFAKKIGILSSVNEKLLIEAVLQRKKVGVRNLLKIRRLINSIWERIVTS